jgi:hypothetical protein
LGDGFLSEHHQVIVIGSGSGGKEAAILTRPRWPPSFAPKGKPRAAPVFIAVVTPFELYLRACSMHYGTAEGSFRFGRSVVPLENSMDRLD